MSKALAKAVTLLTICLTAFACGNGNQECGSCAEIIRAEDCGHDPIPVLEESCDDSLLLFNKVYECACGIAGKCYSVCNNDQWCTGIPKLEWHHPGPMCETCMLSDQGCYYEVNSCREDLG